MWKMREIVNLKGVSFRIHSSFIAIFLVAGFIGFKVDQPWQYGELVLAYVLINLCIVLHELGHVAFGSLAGIRVRQVALSPVGGFALFEDDGNVSPKAEAVMAAGGPLVTIAICGLLFGLNGGVDWSLANASVPDIVLLGNIPILVFNLLPIYPLDGGVLVNAGARALFSDANARFVTKAFSRGTALAGVGLFAAYGAWVLAGFSLAAFVLGPVLLDARR